MLKRAPHIGNIFLLVALSLSSQRQIRGLITLSITKATSDIKAPKGIGGWMGHADLHLPLKRSWSLRSLGQLRQGRVCLQDRQRCRPGRLPPHLLSQRCVEGAGCRLCRAQEKITKQNRLLTDLNQTLAAIITPKQPLHALWDWVPLVPLMPDHLSSHLVWCTGENRLDYKQCSSWLEVAGRIEVCFSHIISLSGQRSFQEFF